MTKDEAMALAEKVGLLGPGSRVGDAHAAAERFFVAIREALAQPQQERPQNCGTGYCSCIECVMEPQQEPVALAATITITQRGSTRTIDNHFEDCVRDWPNGEYKLYTSPPARKPLTDEEVLDMADGCTAQFHDLLSLARAIEAAHGIKE